MNHLNDSFRQHSTNNIAYVAASHMIRSYPPEDCELKFKHLGFDYGSGLPIIESEIGTGYFKFETVYGLERIVLIFDIKGNALYLLNGTHNIPIAYNVPCLGSRMRDKVNAAALFIDGHFEAGGINEQNPLPPDLLEELLERLQQQGINPLDYLPS